METEARFRALFIDTHAGLRRYAIHRGLSAADSDDLVAEVFTIAWRRIEEVPDDATPWLFGVARNVVRNLHRSDVRRARMQTRLPRPEIAPPDDPDANSDSPSVERIRLALASLGERDRELLVLIAWDGLSPQQAAIVLGTTPSATRVRLHRARARLALALDASETPRAERTDPHRERVDREVPDVCT